MATRDPVNRRMVQMEARRFATRCDTTIATVERTDSLRELSRLIGSLNLPYSVMDDFTARDALQRVKLKVEDRARELIQEQLQHFVRAEDTQREKMLRTILDSWGNLTGPLSHLRTWAQSRLTVAKQS
ncbi:MAG TPA: hypothetical protein VJ001_06755 [Rhodocyclaceae bacterium]|nr:hypothetical protein [Rhodocyclaceae bacterium]